MKLTSINTGVILKYQLVDLCSLLPHTARTLLAHISSAAMWALCEFEFRNLLSHGR
jgi:hypothetical protein